MYTIFWDRGGSKLQIQYIMQKKIRPSQRNGKRIDKVKYRYNGKKYPIYYRPASSDVILIHIILVWDREYDIDADPSKFDAILDLGANIGLFSMLYHLRYPEKRIVAVEPEIHNYRLLKRNLKQTGKKAVPVRSGIWWRTSVLEVIDQGEDWAFSVIETDHVSDRSIQGMSIDDIIKDMGIKGRILVKMDIEGSEREIFQHMGTQKWLDNTIFLIMEIHDDEKSALYQLINTEMTCRGFSSSRKGENMIFQRIGRNGEKVR